MTSAPLPLSILPGTIATPAPVEAAGANASGTNSAAGSGEAQIDFSGILVAMLPSLDAPPATEGPAVEPEGHGTKKQSAGKQEDATDDAKAGQGDAAQALVAPVVFAISVEVTPVAAAPLEATETAAPGVEEGMPAAVAAAPAEVPEVAVAPEPAVATPAGEKKSTEATAIDPAPGSGAKVEKPAAPVPDVAREVSRTETAAGEAQAAAAAAAPVMRHTAPAGEVRSDTAETPAAQTPATETKATAEGAVQELARPAEPAKPANTELAFAARLTMPRTTTTPSAGSAARPPELHLAMPPEIRTAMKAQAQAAEPAAIAAEPAAPAPAVPEEPAAASVRSTPAGTARENAIESSQQLPIEPPAASAGTADQDRQASGRPPDGAEPAGPIDQKPRAAAPPAYPETPEHARTENARAAESVSAANSILHRAESVSHGGMQAAARERGAAPAPRMAEVPEPASLRAETKSPVLRELSVVVPGRTGESGRTEPQVEIRVAERTGEVQVAVRSSDPGLASSLRSDLPELVSQLSERGYRTETWHPSSGSAPGEPGVVKSEQSSAESNRDGGFRDSGRGGSDTSGRDGGQQRRGQEQNRPQWLDALERSMALDRVPVQEQTWQPVQ